jgi:hypothetical protein
MSRFVPAGAEDQPPPSDDAWAAARREVSSRGALKPEQPKQDESKSLYETLQANKGGMSTWTCVVILFSTGV